MTNLKRVDVSYQQLCPSHSLLRMQLKPQLKRGGATVDSNHRSRHLYLGKLIYLQFLGKRGKSHCGFSVIQLTMLFSR